MCSRKFKGDDFTNKENKLHHQSIILNTLQLAKEEYEANNNAFKFQKFNALLVFTKNYCFLVHSEQKIMLACYDFRNHYGCDISRFWKNFSSSSVISAFFKKFKCEEIYTWYDLV